MWLQVCFLFITQFNYCLCLCFMLGCLGTFFVNEMPTLVLFYSGATCSFVSLALKKRFDVALSELDFPLEVDIVDDHPMRVSTVHRSCILKHFRESYPINLVPIPLHESKVIVGMELLSPNGAMIDCEH